MSIYNSTSLTTTQSEFIPTTLYIKTHNKTGLKYFGKTTSDPFTYSGSGKHWLAHLRKHGNDVTTEIYGHYTVKDECVNAAVDFSVANNIVNALNENNKKIWANQIIENGLDGWVPGVSRSSEQKAKQSIAMKGRKQSAETIAKKSLSSKGRVAWNKGKPALNKGKPMSEEQKAKQSAMMKGRTQSTEQKAKHSEKMKAYWTAKRANDLEI